MSQDKQIWLAIDATNWVHQLWYALHGNRVAHHACHRLGILAKALNAARVLVCFDRRSFRHDLYPPYKQQRAEKDASLRDTLAGCERWEWPGQLVYQEGYEADDLLATAAAAAVAGGAKCVLATADKDCWQCLVEGLVSVWRNFGTHGDAILSRDVQTARDLEIGEKTAGLRPWQWADYQALIGESGDNVPGCPSWGPKTARPALVKFGSVTEMLAARWNLSCTRAQLAKFERWYADQYPLVRQLVTLRTDAEAIWDAVR